MICEATLGLALAASHFTLSWTHSVTQTQWLEHWEASAQGLRPISAVVQGPGAGMEIPDHALRVQDGWFYRLDMAPQKTIWLAASGQTPDGWRLCTDTACHQIGETEGPPLQLYWAQQCP